MVLSRWVLAATFQDPYDSAQVLLCSTNEADRVAGLKNLARSWDPRAGDAALAGYRFSSSIAERLAGEATLATLAPGSKELARASILTAVRKWERQDSSYWSNSELEQSLEHLGLLYCLADLGADERQKELDTILLRWWETVDWNLRNDEVWDILNQAIVIPTYNQTQHQLISQLCPEQLTAALRALHLIHILRAVDGEVAQQVRSQMLDKLPLSNFAVLVVDSFARYVDQPIVHNAISRLAKRWFDEHGPVGPHAEFLASLNIRFALPPTLKLFNPGEEMA